MPHMKKGTGSGSGVVRRNYRDHYSEHAAQVVRRVYGKEVDEFNYTF